MAGLRQIVEPPTFTPLPYGLITAMQPRPGADRHWLNGVTYQSLCMMEDVYTTYDECIAVTGTGSPPASAALGGNAERDTRGATAFTVYAEFDCSPVGVTDHQALATEALARVESWQVERAVWTGTAGANPVVFPHLAANAEVVDASGILLQDVATVPVTGALKPVRALGILEGALADCYNGVGIVHIPQFVLPAFTDTGPIQTRGPRLETTNGNLVVVGAGYPGTSPSGTAPAAGQGWIYATGAMMMYRGDVRTFDLRESIDRAENTVKMIAQRPYLFGWDCCHFAILVDLT